MAELRDLNELAHKASDKMDAYDGRDFELPEKFKQQVTKIYSRNITYNRYSAIATSGSNHPQKIYMPNQWFYIASYFTDLYNELQIYREYALKVVPDESRVVEVKKSQQLNDEELNRLSALDLDDKSKEFVKRFLTDYNWWAGGKSIDRNDYYVSPILYFAGLVNASQSYVAELCMFLADKHDLTSTIIASVDGDEHFEHKSATPIDTKNSLQIIYYGAPGTGKSHTIKEQTEGKQVIRTTFHPDSDYSTFVGAYKPTTKEVYVRDSTGRVVEEGGEKVVEDRIVYEFVPQAFLQAYVSAWRAYAKAENGVAEKQYLVIEEINRGNCAQIFGDLFQLLDRNDDGYSEYPITADKDMEKYLSQAFEDIALTDEDTFSRMYDDPFAAQKISLGQVLVLPPNLYIWATMNTSDQSLFPIDSAFKRRWDWKYVPISEAVENNEPLGWKIHVDGKDYDWWSFLQAINKEIGELTNSQDKKLGYFFCKAKDGKISSETFVDKVLFFLWNEVLKDFEPTQQFLDDGNGGYLAFDQFYKVNEFGKTKIEEDKVVKLLENLGVSSADSEDDIKPNDAEDSSTSTDSSLLSKYLDFWNKFQESYDDSGEFKELFSNPKGQRQNWLDIGGLNRSYHICLSVNYRTRKIRMQVYFRQDKDTDALDKYINSLDKVSEAMGQEVTTGAGAKFTYLQLYKDFDMDANDWQIAFDWFHQECVKFKHLADEIDPK